MSSIQGRINIAEAQLALLGEPSPGEPSEVTEKREHYQEMLDEARVELSQLHNSRLPYREDD